MKTKKIILIAGDTLIFLLVFLLTLYGRWRTNFNQELIAEHLIPFAFVYLGSLTVIYAMGLYSAQYLSRKLEWITSAIIGLFIILLVTASFFYFYGRVNPGLTPRGTLLLNWVLFSLLFITWRVTIEKTILNNLSERTLVIGRDRQAIEFAEVLKQAAGIDFEITDILPGTPETYGRLAKYVQTERVENIVFVEPPPSREAQTLLAQMAELNVNCYDQTSLYEQRLQKIYLDSISHLWILNNIIKRRSPLALNIHDTIQRLIACFLAVLFLPLIAFIWLTIIIINRQNPVYAQERIGKDRRPFKLYKFKTMRDNAEPNGPQWAADDDPRVTKLGRILRTSHLDELPQLINIIKGDMSFVGPRPERPAFVTELEKTIPFYAMRHHIKPGVTGWAQINYPYGASVNDAKEKLQYDLFYLKQRSIFVDLMIIIRTIRSVFQKPWRT